MRTLNLFHFASTYDLEVNSSYCLPHISFDFSSENMVFNQTINLRNTGNRLLLEGKLSNKRGSCDMHDKELGYNIRE